MQSSVESKSLRYQAIPHNGLFLRVLRASVVIMVSHGGRQIPAC